MDDDLLDAYEALFMPDLPALAPPAPAWQRHAACVGMDLDAFYPERTADGPDPKDVIAETRKVCAGCPVREPCAAWAVERGEHGLWGGTTDGERRAMRRQAA